MSNPDKTSNIVLKDKNPHNYRKVGYSMIVISISLVLIGLLVMTIGQNYHFSGDLMAGQEIASMTPKSGYSLVIFDYTQPVGAKIQIQGHVDTISQAQELKTQLEKEQINQKGMALIFDSSVGNNTSSVSLAEVFALTPSYGYNVISFNTAFPAGARLSSLIQDSNSSAAQADSQSASTQITDPKIHVIVFSTSYDDNLKQVLGSNYDPGLVSSNINQFKIMSPKLIIQPPEASTASGTNQTTISLQNSTTANPINSTSNANSTNTKPATNTSAIVENLSTSINVAYSSTHARTIHVSENIGIKLE
jgi:hypothetical protein